MNEKYKVQGLACLIAAPFWGWALYSLYDYLAHQYDNPANFIVNLTGIIGLAGLLALIIAGIVNLVKAKKMGK